MSLLLQIAIFASLALLLHRIEGIRRRLDALDRTVPRRDDAPFATASPPADVATRPAAPVRSGTARSAPASSATTTVGLWPAPQDRPTPAASLLTPPAPAPLIPGEHPPGRPGLDVELGFGRRWAALLGGGLVALGLALLVRHSIQQGLLPPWLRLAGAAMLSLALCAAAEFFRRRGTFANRAEADLNRHSWAHPRMSASLHGHEKQDQVGEPTRSSLARRAADIPSILLGTGLAGVFAVTYAAHAAYGYLEAGPAFVIMVAAALSGIAAAFAYGPALAVLGYLAAQGVPLLVGDTGTAPAAAYVTLVGVAGYGAAHRGRWRHLENPAGLILLFWGAWLGWGAPMAHILVALPASAAALAVTVARLRPRAAWTDWRQSRRACGALALVAGQGLLLLYRPAEAFSGVPGATIMGFAVLLAAFACAATATRARAMAPVLAVALVGGMAILGLRLGARAPAEVAAILGLVSAVVLGVAATALHRGSRRAPLTGLVGTASAAVLLGAGDLVLRLTGGIDRGVLAALACAQGAALVSSARPRHGSVPPVRQFATAVAASAGVGLIGAAPLVAGAGDNPLTVLMLAATAAGAAALAAAWTLPLVASVAGIAAIPVILCAGAGLVRSLAATGGGALGPFLEITLLPGLVLAGTVLFLHRRFGTAVLREADRRWLGLLGATPRASQAGPAVSLVLAGTAAGALLGGALVGTVRDLAYGDPFAPLSAPADLGLACALLLSGALAAFHLHRAIGYAALRPAAGALIMAALPLSAATLLANPLLTGMPIGMLPLLNLLALAYLLPAIAAWRLGRMAPTDVGRRRSTAAMTIAGLFAYATFGVAQAFQGPVLTLARITEAELWTYTAVWLLMGAALMAYGLRFGARAMRLTALGVFGVTAAKVVAIDLADLTGTARAASVLALGLVLLGTGMAYQRLASTGNHPPDA